MLTFKNVKKKKIDCMLGYFRLALFECPWNERACKVTSVI